MTVEVVDGLLDVMPWGIGVPFQQQMSNLANAYRRSEIVESGIGIFALEALIVDRPEPAEALRATTVWSTGLAAPLHSVDPRAVTAARDGRPFPESSSRTGRPGSFLINATLDIEPGQTHRWHVVADVAQSHVRHRSARFGARDQASICRDRSTTTSICARRSCATSSPAPTALRRRRHPRSMPTTSPTPCSTSCAAARSLAATRSSPSGSVRSWTSATPTLAARHADWLGRPSRIDRRGRSPRPRRPTR